MAPRSSQSVPNPTGASSSTAWSSPRYFRPTTTRLSSRPAPRIWPSPASESATSPSTPTTQGKRSWPPVQLLQPHPGLRQCPDADAARRPQPPGRQHRPRLLRAQARFPVHCLDANGLRHREATGSLLPLPQGPHRRRVRHLALLPRRWHRLFTLVSARYERGSIILTSNKGFGFRW